MELFYFFGCILVVGILCIFYSRMQIYKKMLYAEREDRQRGGVVQVKSHTPPVEKTEAGEVLCMLSQAYDTMGLKPYHYEVNEDKIYSNIGSGSSVIALQTFISRYIHPGFRKDFEDLVAEVCRGVRDSFQIKIQTYSHGGALEWTDIRGTGIDKDANGYPCRIVGVRKNITTEMENEWKLKEQAFKIELVSKSGKAGLWDYNVKEDLFFYSDSDRKMFLGYTWKQYLESVHPDDRLVLAGIMQQILNNEMDVLQVAYRLRIPGGEGYHWFDIAAVVSKRDAEGNPSVISGLRWDITTNILEKQQLEKSKAMLEMTFAASGIIPWEFDLNTRKLSSNNENSLFYHQSYTDEEYIREYVHPDHQELVSMQVERLLKEEQDSLNLKVLTFYNGQYEWTEIVGKKVQNVHFSFYNVVGTCQIITAEVEKQEELIRLRKEAEESNRLKSMFLANMGHEIRTPLNAIVGFSDLITQTDNPKEAKEYSEVIASNNELLLQLVNDILDLSRIEAGQMEFHLSNVDICEIFKGLNQTYSLKIPEGVQLFCETPDTSCMIYTDKNRLMQVISNFLNNAVKFTTQGNISMGYSHSEGNVRCYVKDTGIGIAKDDIPKVFERFARFDSFASGTGLGLSICETIIQHLGGKIGVSSELGQGSEFWFVIPDTKILSGSLAN